MNLLFDPMFRVPFLTGLLLALSLPQLGLLLSLRREWLATLGIAHLAGAGGIIGGLLALPALPAALLAAVAGVTIRSLQPRASNELYAMMILAGWSLGLITASLSQDAHGIGQLLVDGQLYFTTRLHLLVALPLTISLLVCAGFMMRGLLQQQLMPTPDYAIRHRQLQWLLSAFLAIGVSLTAMTMGIMAAFALLFVPAWVASGIAASWQQARWLISGLALLCYLLAYTIALLADLPFGPVFVMTLALSGMLRWLPPRHND
ncbi:MAG: ABC transporter [Gammaproteobacteria bacterium HGW-Gammaproteobacteria-14]|nr:MAG: ABC transporter [Gammaproteobacteria bacterium HGW-Gammaproteobacteria-14]